MLLKITLLIGLIIIFILFIFCMLAIALSDTETYKAIDRKIANKIKGRN